MDYENIGDEGVLFLSGQRTHHVLVLSLGTITLIQMAMASLGEECRALPELTGPPFNILVELIEDRSERKPHRQQGLQVVDKSKPASTQIALAQYSSNYKGDTKLSSEGLAHLAKAKLPLLEGISISIVSIRQIATIWEGERSVLC